MMLYYRFINFYEGIFGKFNLTLLNSAFQLGVVVVLGFMTLLTSQVISVAFYSEREKSYKFCSEVLISA